MWISVTKNEIGETVLHCSARNPESLKFLLALIPEELRLDAVKMTDYFGQMVLHKATENPESLKVLFALIPEEQRVDTFKMTDKYGGTVLHFSAKNPESLKALITLIPEKQRLDVVKMANMSGDTVLHCSAKNPESLKALITLIPEEQRLDALKVVNVFGKTVLNYSAENPESLKVLLALIPEKHRLDALKVTNKYGETVLRWARKNPESLKVIQALTSPQKPVSPDAFFQPAPSFETPPTAPKVSNSRPGRFNEAEKTLFEQFIVKFNVIPSSLSLKEKKSEAIESILIIIKKANSIDALDEFYKALNTWELQQPFFKKERHFIRTASGKTESWQTTLGFIKTQAMELAKKESPEKLIENSGSYENLFKIHRSRLGFGKTYSMNEFEKLTTNYQRKP